MTSRIRNWCGKLAYDLGFFVGRCLPVSIIIWTISGFNSQFLQSSADSPHCDGPVSTPSEAQTFEQAVGELSDEFIVVRSPNVRLTEIN